MGWEVAGPALGLLLVCICGALAQDVLPAACFASDWGLTRDMYSYCKVLSPQLALHWNVEAGYITFAAAVAGKYKMVGLGISNSGGMRGADMAIMLKEESITAGTSWRIGDYFSQQEGVPPVMDAADHQDWTLVSYSGTAQTTLAVISRKLDTCDTQDIKIYNDTDQTIIWALGQQFGYHGALRGSQVLRLNPSNLTSTLNLTALTNGTTGVNIGNTTEFTYRLALLAQDPPDLSAVVIAMPSVAVGPSLALGTPLPTTCMSYGLKSKAKYHIIRYEGVTPLPGSVARMTLYGCTAQPTDMNDPRDCGGRPDPVCSTPLLVWAPSVGNFSLPPQAGLPFGMAPYFQYVELVVEYRADAVQAGFMDSSSLRLYYTGQLRPFDGGLLQLGYGLLGGSVPLASVVNGTLPGQVNATSDDNECPSACTARLGANVTLVSNFFAMGSTGQGIMTRHVRNGSELQPLGWRNWYLSKYQAFTQVLPDSRTLLPGDSLITTCHYNTTTTAIRGAPSTPMTISESCVNYLLYYPAVPGFTQCSRQGAGMTASCPLAPRVGGGNSSATLATNATAVDVQMAGVQMALQDALRAALSSQNLTASTSPWNTMELADLSSGIANAALVAAGGSAGLASLLQANLTTNTRPFLLGPNSLPASPPDALAVFQSWLASALSALPGAPPGPGTAGVSSLALLIGRITNTSLDASNSSVSSGQMLVDALVLATPFTSAMQQALPFALVTTADTNFTAFIQPCLLVAPIVPQVLYTGQALAGSIGTIAAMLGLIALLWVKYARKEDPERQALLSSLRQVILQESAANPDVTEEQLTSVWLKEVAAREQAAQLTLQQEQQQGGLGGLGSHAGGSLMPIRGKMRR